MFFTRIPGESWFFDEISKELPKVRQKMRNLPKFLGIISNYQDSSEFLSEKLI
jgi:hypothetical protein